MYEFRWFNCAPGLAHKPKNLTITQIIPKDGKKRIYLLLQLSSSFFLLLLILLPCNQATDTKVGSTMSNNNYYIKV